MVSAANVLRQIRPPVWDPQSARLAGCCRPFRAGRPVRKMTWSACESTSLLSGSSHRTSPL
eukprot:13508223-Alexandrium_andersonii.AAC.1